MTENADRKSLHWLADYSRDVYSQFGEDGVIQKALELLPINDRWCVEFGAWDGVHLSNTANLIRNQQFNSVLIEADPARFEVLKSNYVDNPKVQAINGFVGWRESDGLDQFLRQTNIPKDFDLLSIDIDGNDFHVWNAVQEYRPKLVVIEFNPTIPSEVDYVQPAEETVMHGSSGLGLTRLGTRKGYQLIHVSRANLIFVDSAYADHFGDLTGSFAEMRSDSSDVTYLFTGYDGTTLLSGRDTTLWNSVSFRKQDVQIIPRWLRRFPSSYSAWQRLGIRLVRWRKSGRTDTAHNSSADFK